MSEDGLLCLGRFENHSFDPWWWNGDHYYRECCWFGCPFSETAKTLVPSGRTTIGEGAASHDHDWAPWCSTEDQFGLILPPWRYKRECRSCHVEQKNGTLGEGG